MDSIENGATIRIGFKIHYKERRFPEIDYSIAEYSLKINKKTITIIGSSGTIENYTDSCIKNAKEIAKLMNERGVKNYVIFNGERLDWNTHKWESCKHIPKDGEEVFKKTLEETLKN